MAVRNLLRRASVGLLLSRSLPGPCSFHPLPCRTPFRWISSTSPNVDLELLKVLRAELKHQEEVASLQDWGSPPGAFKLVDKPGVQELLLHRTFGDEDIDISCVLHDQSYPPADEEEGYEPPKHNIPTKMVQMTIKIATGPNKPFLKIVCCNFGVEVHIESVLLKDPTVDYKIVPYEGPDFSQLDAKVKLGFVKYLAARGIDGPLGSFLMDFMANKGQRDYSSWLRKVELFVKK